MGQNTVYSLFNVKDDIADSEIPRIKKFESSIFVDKTNREKCLKKSKISEHISRSVQNVSYKKKSKNCECPARLK
ncbi:unnamed protein product [Cunninghamella echinulata]